MFVLALMQKAVRTRPHEFGWPFEQVLERRLNDELSNKVVPGLGLCIILYELVEVGASHLLPGDGSSHTSVKFRFVVFRPFIDEVIEATVLSSSRKGLQLSLTFFEDIFIPSFRLPRSSSFEEGEQVWYWNYQQEDGESAKLYMDPGKVVKFRVVQNIFKDLDPNAKVDDSKDEKSYQIVGSMSQDGLGCVLWWTPTGEEVTEGEQEEQGEEKRADN